MLQAITIAILPTRVSYITLSDSFAQPIKIYASVMILPTICTFTDHVSRMLGCATPTLHGIYSLHLFHMQTILVVICSGTLVFERL